MVNSVRMFFAKCISAGVGEMPIQSVASEERPNIPSPSGCSDMGAKLRVARSRAVWVAVT